MNEENKNTITYDEGWESVTESEYPVVGSAAESENEDKPAPEDKKKKDNSPKQLLITIQLIICILIALAALVIKSIGGEFYATVRDMYYSNLNNSAIFEDSNGINIDNIFGLATQDETENK